MTTGTVASPAARRTWVGGGLAYVVMLAAAVGAFLLVNRLGGGVVVAGATAAAAAAAAPKGASDVLPQVLVTLIAMVIVGQVFGRLFRYFGQPPVIGEVLAGIMLGPSLLG